MAETVLIIINLIVFGLCVYDKLAAKLGLSRIPEIVLLGFSACFGSVGMLAGMYLFRHKTKHKRFVICVPIFLVIQIIILAMTGIVGVKNPI